MTVDQSANRATAATAATTADPQPRRKLDLKDRNAVIVQYTPYVRSIAGKIKKTLAKEIEFEDLVEYGMIGLLEAAERYDSAMGANFMTFAYYRIRGAIYDGLRGMGWMSRSEYARVRYEEKANAYLAQVSEENAADPAAPQKTEEEKAQQVVSMLQNMSAIYITNLDGMEGLQVKDENAVQADESIGNEQARIAVNRAVSKLSEQERQLLDMYYYREMSLQEVGEKLGLSKSWTSRLHARVIEKLHRLLKDELGQATAG
ncbi:MAG: sigma-70 family RNA polymerase sigma factor [Deltaproteobacteria bacterium]|nr:sigma-70 family RNA polymerase sigma factor [Deltaproteobacteria bacterium]